MKYLPCTIFGQMSCLLLILLIVNLLISFIALRCFIVDPSASQFANIITNQLLLFKIELQNFDFQQAQTWLQQHLPNSQYLIQQQAETLPKLPKVRFYQLIQQQLNSNSQPLLIRLSHEDTQSRLWFQASWMQGYWLGIPFQAYLQNMYNLMVIIFSLIALLSLITGYLISAYLLKPLEQLGHLAESLTHMDKKPNFLKQRGPKEIRQVSQLIEKSAQQMRKLIEDRELVIAGVSHDLRTPLARLRVAIEWMEDISLRQDMIDDIEEMDAIIDDFLDYMRAGQYEIEQTIDITVFLEKIITTFQREGHIIYLEISHPQSVKLRPIAITRLLTNLLNNALKHGKKPIHLVALEQSGQYQLWVKDRGEGIDETQINTLLEPFAQGKVSRSKGGSGLGLAIAKRIAQTHHAEFIIKNRPKGGLKAGIIFNRTIY